jgi:hypothetical protein
MIRFFVSIPFLFLSFCGLSQSYQPGYFYTVDNKRIKGFIKYSTIQSGHLLPGGSIPGHIKIKTEIESRAFEMDANELTGFVAARDSFIVLRNIPVSEHDHFARDLVKVEVLGKLNLYIHYSQLPNGRFGSRLKKIYIVQRSSSRKMFSIYDRYQKEQFISFLRDDPELVSSVESDWSWLDHIPETVKRYNTNYMKLNARR